MLALANMQSPEHRKHDQSLIFLFKYDIYLSCNIYLIMYCLFIYNLFERRKSRYNLRNTD